MKRAMSAMSKEDATMVVIDGNLGEGGGQVLRNSVAYASLLQRPLRIHSIRAKRSKPGLAAQHVASIQVAAQVGGGVLQGDVLKSTEISYLPPDSKQQQDDATTNTATERTVTGIVQTAGSICLLLQAALPCALLGSSSATKLVLQGGTNADLAPQYDYWERVFLPTLLTWLGTVPIQATVVMRGYNPRGGGQVEVRVPSLQQLRQLPMPPLQLTERGTVQHIYIRAFHAGKLPRHLAATMADAAKKHLEVHLDQQDCTHDMKIEVDIVTESNAVGSGLGILLVATTTTHCRLGGSTLGSPKQDKNQAGMKAAQELLDTLKDGGSVDEWMQDQLILFMALAQGTSTILTGSLTLHTQTAIQVAQQMVPGVQFEVNRLAQNDSSSGGSGNQKSASGGYGKDGRIPGKHIITCHGIGYTGQMQ